ncbi:hypothetical protein, partial [Luteibacter sp.]|uniref:hypothetical protein n=1 Tax=Luteibacter sp. TaxID=1886636 RepID=UPI003F8053EF
DVFEHIPYANDVMASVRSVLHDGGVLSIAIPSSRGVFYKISKALARAGISGPFERMWQKSFSSPHLHYFHADGLDAVARRHGFEPVYRGTLPSVRLNGLWDRLAYDTTSGIAKNAIVFGGVALALPFLRLLPADIDLLMYRKVNVSP